MDKCIFIPVNKRLKNPLNSNINAPEKTGALWTLLGSNQRPPDYESGALTV
jgi:hypothetical protein